MANAKPEEPAPEVALAPAPKTIVLPPGEQSITVSVGGTVTRYQVTDDEIVVDDAHVAAVLAALPGSELKPEAPAKEN